MSDYKYAEVAPAVPLGGHVKQQSYTYQLPANDEARLYQLATISLGPRKVAGVITKLHNEKPRFATKQLKLKQEFLTAEQFSLAEWIAKTAHGGLGFTLRLFVGAEQDSSVSKSKITPLCLAITEKETRRRVQQLRKMAKQLKGGLQTLIIVPEKHLLKDFEPQKYGAKKTAIVTADLTAKQLRTIAQDVAAGKITTVIGTQKALFLPYKKLGLVVVDEDFYSTHKLWDQYPRLDNRLAAEKLAQLHGAGLVFSGSVVSLATQYLLNEEKCLLWRDNPLELRSRLIVLSQQDWQRRWPLPQETLSQIKRWLRKKEKIFILYNRHDELGGKIKKVLRDQLPRTAEKYILFDTEAALRDLKLGDIDRLVWVNPERALSFPDFRSQEHVLNLFVRLQQLLPGRRSVWISTRQPRVVKTLMLDSWEKMMTSILKERKKFNYPPFADLVRLTIAEKSAKKALQAADKISSTIYSEESKTTVRGPFEAFESETKGKKEAHLLLSGDLDVIQQEYANLKLDRVDVSPARVL